MGIPTSGPLSTNTIADEVGFPLSSKHNLGSGANPSSNTLNSLVYFFRNGNVATSGVPQSGDFNFIDFRGQEAIYRCVGFSAIGTPTGSVTSVQYYKDLKYVTFTQSKYKIRQNWDGKMDIRGWEHCTYSVGPITNIPGSPVDCSSIVCTLVGTASFAAPPTTTSTTTTTTTSISIDACSIFFIDHDTGKTYAYNFSANTIQLVSELDVFAGKIEISNNKLWITSLTTLGSVKEYNLSFNPLSITHNRDISIPNNNSIILYSGTNILYSGHGDSVYRLDISTTTGSETKLFTLPSNASPLDIYHDSGRNEFWITYRTSLPMDYIGRFSGDGTLIYSSSSIYAVEDNANGLFSVNGYLYIMFTNGDIYSVNTVTLAITYVKTVTGLGDWIQIWSVGQRVSCTSTIIIPATTTTTSTTTTTTTICYTNSRIYLDNSSGVSKTFSMYLTTCDGGSFSESNLTMPSPQVIWSEPWTLRSGTFVLPFTWTSSQSQSISVQVWDGSNWNTLMSFSVNNSTYTNTTSVTIPNTSSYFLKFKITA